MSQATRQQRAELPSEAETFAQLFERLYPSVVYFFQRQGFGREESRDLAQDTFLRVYKGMGGFREEARIETWLFRIAKNLASNARRYDKAARRRHEEVSLEETLEQGQPIPQGSHLRQDPGALDPLEELLDDERTCALRQAVEELPPKMRQVLLLRVDQNLKYREIALLLEVSIETVKAHLHQAKRLLTAKVGSPLPPAEERFFREDEP